MTGNITHEMVRGCNKCGYEVRPANKGWWCAMCSPNRKKMGFKPEISDEKTFVKFNKIEKR